MSVVQLDEATHTYRLDGVILPSVTQIIGSLYDFKHVDPDLLERASDFGKAVHTACELDDNDDLDYPGLDQALRPYVDAWRSFKQTTKFKVSLNEGIVYSKKFRYAGTLDRFGILCRGPTCRQGVVDIKTCTNLHPAIGLQTAGYEIAAREMGLITGRSCTRYAVQLRGDGTYRMQEYKDASDANYFLSFLNCHRWKLDHAV